ncbi:MAG: arginine--tRNA ligase [Puniceicoccales bacterium]|jgi:arginyl-tRNA synthetase|nr:arginine--tRNA ligase [Puniceicoccales bacterium]
MGEKCYGLHYLLDFSREMALCIRIAMGGAPFDFQRHFEGLIGSIGRGRCAFGDDFCPLVRPAAGRFGDFQCNGILAMGGRFGQNPRQLAEKLCAELMLDGTFRAIASAEVAGPGFVNVELNASAIGDWLATYGDGENFRRAASAATELAGRTVVVDYSCPNSAKRMHVGHLRSMVIGNAICRMEKFFGAKALGDNHIGDWGTQFGIVLRQIAEEGLDLDSLSGDDALDCIEELYRRGAAAVERSPNALLGARRELVALQVGDPVRLSIWRKINELSYGSFQRIYDLCDVQFDMVLGESFYAPMVERVYGELLRCGVAVEDDGALVVFHGEHDRFGEQPFIVRKSDGASNYAATDLATVLYRVEELGADEIIYVTDGRQRDHFEQLFLTVRKWFGAMGYAVPTLRHVWFGTVCGDGGKAIKTRSGESPSLQNLFDSAIGQAVRIVAEKSSVADLCERERIARAVAVGAIKYGDLCQNRTSDYVFSLDSALTFDGNTAPYLQYACARIGAIVRRGADEGATPSARPVPETAEERTLARRLVFFPIALAMAMGDFRPHVLCSYLYDLAVEFSSFYGANRIFGEGDVAVARRLGLCKSAGNFLEIGLKLLAIEPLGRM